MNKLKFLTLSIALMSCAAKKETVHEIVSKKSDTLIIKEEKVISKGGNYSLTIDNLCDSITKKPKSFGQKVEFDGSLVNILIDENNKLRLEVEKKSDTIKHTRDVIDRSVHFESDHKLEKIVVFKAPRWAYATLIISVIFVLYIVVKIARRLR